MEDRAYFEALEETLKRRHEAKYICLDGYAEESLCMEKTAEGWLIFRGERYQRENSIYCVTALETCLTFLREMETRIEETKEAEDEFIRVLSKDRVFGTIRVYLDSLNNVLSRHLSPDAFKILEYGEDSVNLEKDGPKGWDVFTGLREKATDHVPCITCLDACIAMLKKAATSYSDLKEMENEFILLITASN